MKQGKYYFYKYKVVLLLLLVLSHCARMSISVQCVEGEEEGVCQKEKQGQTKLLVKKSVDILIVLDNSPKGQKLNPQITANLSQFVRCIEPLDWRVGIVPGTEDKKTPIGHLVNVERAGPALYLGQDSAHNGSGSPLDQASAHNGSGSSLGQAFVHTKVISPDMADYKQAFQETVSLSSGCDKPPFCYKGKRKPLSALQAFMHNAEDKKLLLRKSAHFVVVVVSSSDEEGGFFDNQVMSAQETLSTVSLEYGSDKWTAFSVTDAGKADDCINTTQDLTRKGTKFLATLGDIVGVLTLDPAIMLGSAILKSQANKPQKSTQELSSFVSGGGGQAFDICKPFFGRAVAYSLLQKVGRESQFPEKCKQFDKSQLDSLKKTNK